MKVVAALAAMALMPTGMAQSGWTPMGKITSYVVVYNGGVNVAMDPGLSGCTSHSGYGPAYASLYPDNPGFKSLQALLLAAYISGKTHRSLSGR